MPCYFCISEVINLHIQSPSHPNRTSGRHDVTQGSGEYKGNKVTTPLSNIIHHLFPSVPNQFFWIIQDRGQNLIHPSQSFAVFECLPSITAILINVYDNGNICSMESLYALSVRTPTAPRPCFLDKTDREAHCSLSLCPLCTCIYCDEDKIFKNAQCCWVPQFWVSNMIHFQHFLKVRPFEGVSSWVSKKESPVTFENLSLNNIVPIIL